MHNYKLFFCAVFTLDLNKNLHKRMLCGEKYGIRTNMKGIP